MPDIIVISDIHASERWEKMVAKRAAEDAVIFLGDYFDRRGRGPFAASQVDNFIEICHYARSHPYTTLLLGNHDYYYGPWSSYDMSFEPDAAQIQDALKANIDLLEILVVADFLAKPSIFSHGGLTQTFMRLHGLKKPEEVNALWRVNPGAFEWIPRDPISGTRSNRYGDDPWQSPLWARTDALYRDGLPGYDQIVGHTIVPELQAFETVNGDTVLLTCTLDDTPVLIPTK